jgi:hypothetical protein
MARSAGAGIVPCDGRMLTHCPVPVIFSEETSILQRALVTVGRLVRFFNAQIAKGARTADRYGGGSGQERLVGPRNRATPHLRSPVIKACGDEESVIQPTFGRVKDDIPPARQLMS